MIIFSAQSPPWLFFLFLLASSHVARAALPLVDFDRMGKVGLAGAFAGLDLFDNSSTSVAFDSSTSTLLSRSADGALSRLGSTNSGGKIEAGCALGNTFYFAGSFSSIGDVSASNLASYDPSSASFSALGSNGPNGDVHSLFCDEANSKVWAGGQFTSPSPSVAVWDTKASSWSAPPFGGLSGAAAEVRSITTNSSASSLFFSGSFLTSFQGSSLNTTNNPNVPFSSGATPFSSSLVPVPLQNAEVEGAPSSTNSQFSDIKSILCPSGSDGPGNTWLAADGNSAQITVRTFQSTSASGIRLGNTFLNGQGTTGFSVTSIPDNTVQQLHYVDPTTGENKTCTGTCPLSTDSAVPYQDFTFDNTLTLTGVQVTLSEWKGAGPGLHIFQLLSSGAFASSIASQNVVSCFAPAASNVSRTGDWTEKDVNTNIPGTTQSILVSEVNVGTAPANAPSFTWQPYVSASGQYDINLYIPGCTNFQDCALRTSVKVVVFPGGGQQPWVTTVPQTNTDDTTQLVYRGPVVPSSPDFVATVSMTLADTPIGSGQDGKYELVADRVQLVLTSANTTASSNGTNGVNGRNGFGFFEWPLSSSSTANATGTLDNSTETSLDNIGFGLFNALGGSTSLTSTTKDEIAAVAHHASGTVILGGTFSLSSPSASNIVLFKNGALTALSGGGLNGPVTSLVLDGDKLFVGGSFTNTAASTSQGTLRGIAMYDVQQDQWSALQAGVNGAVTSLSFSDGQIQAAGNFTTLLSASGSDVGSESAGIAVWNVSSNAWANSGGFLIGSMTFVGNGTAPSKGQQQSQFVAGNVVSSLKIGASGFVMLQNGGSDGVPQVTPLGVELDGLPSSTSATATRRRRGAVHARSGATAWISHVKLPALFSRQSSSSLAPLPSTPAALAPAVLAGTFWMNSSTSEEVVIIGGNFSFASGTTQASGVALYNPTSGTLAPLQGAQINGTVRALLVDNGMLFVGGEFTLPGTSANGLAVYDLTQQQWETSNVQALQASSGSSVVVRSLTTSTAKANTVIVAGSFTQAGSLTCRAVCSLDTSSKQWNVLGNGIQGEVTSVSYAGNNQDVLVAAGSISLSGNNPNNVVEFVFANSSWAALGGSSDLPGPVTAVEVNNLNASSIFAAGRSFDGTSSFLYFWNGASWKSLGSTLQGATNVSQLAMVPLQDTHSANGIIEPDRMLLVSGSLSDSSFGNASSALFDGQTFIPYIISSSSSGTPGAISSLFTSLASFSFAQHHFLATGVVILISIAIAAGVVFLLVLTGILWTLFSRRDDALNKFDVNAVEEDDDSAQHRPSSLLAHITAATRTTITGSQNPFNNFNSEKEEEMAAAGAATSTVGHDPFSGPDASNYIRAETPSDAIAGMGGEEDAGRPAHARYSFDGAGEGELPLSEGQELEILDDRDHSWWYARDPRSGAEGVVPAAYLY